jgi:hypothetical protein
LVFPDIGFLSITVFRAIASSGWSKRPAVFFAVQFRFGPGRGGFCGVLRRPKAQLNDQIYHVSFLGKIGEIARKLLDEALCQ